MAVHKFGDLYEVELRDDHALICINDGAEETIVLIDSHRAADDLVAAAEFIRGMGGFPDSPGRMPTLDAGTLMGSSGPKAIERAYMRGGGARDGVANTDQCGGGGGGQSLYKAAVELGRQHVPDAGPFPLPRPGGP